MTDESFSSATTADPPPDGIDSVDPPPPSQNLVVRENQAFATIEIAAGLPAESLSLVGLRLTNPEMTYDDWEAIGRSLGHAHRWSAWALGDWINFGEAIFGEAAAQATEGATVDRYDVAGRVTGLGHGTLMNYASQCGRIPISIRRVELPFGTHGPVAALEPEQQREWLQKAVENAWTRQQLRDAIDGKEPEPEDEGAEDGVEPGDAGPTIGERIEEAARLVWRQASNNGDGDWLVPNEAMNQLATALGEEQA